MDRYGEAVVGFFYSFFRTVVPPCPVAVPVSIAGAGTAFPRWCQGIVGLVWPLGGAALMRMVTEMCSEI